MLARSLEFVPRSKARLDVCSGASSNGMRSRLEEKWRPLEVEWSRIRCLLDEEEEEEEEEVRERDACLPVFQWVYCRF